jgi:hypothetical protein
MDCKLLEKFLRNWVKQRKIRANMENMQILMILINNEKLTKKCLDPKSTLPAGGIVDIIWHNPFHLNGPTKFELLSGEEILAKLEPIDESGAANDKKFVSFYLIKL